MAEKGTDPKLMPIDIMGVQFYFRPLVGEIVRLSVNEVFWENKGDGKDVLSIYLKEA